MGTQAYCIAATKYTETRPKNLRFVATDSENTTYNMEEFAEGISYNWSDEDNEVDFTHFISEQSCRELILDDLEILAEMYNRSKSLILGIKMAGEQHDKVSRLMQGKVKTRLVQDILSRVLRYSDLELRSGRFATLKSKKSWRPYGNCSVSRGMQRKELPFFVDVYFSYRSLRNEQFSIKLSALIALLREPRIIGGIVKGQITSTEDVVKELLKIAEDRQSEKDESYLCWALGGFSGNDYDIKRQLRWADNDDASDGYSIAMLAMFLMGVHHEECIGTDWTGSNGPVNFMEDNLDPYAMAKVLKASNIDISNIAGGTMETICDIMIDQELDEEFS